jgi:hypothetical protein
MYVALNISNTSIKLLSLQGRKVKKWGSLDLEEGLVRDGLVLNPQSVGEAISSLFKSARIPKENVITSLAGLPFTYRFIDLPVMKPALLDDAIMRATAKEISLPLEELYLSWKSLPPRGKEQPFFVLGVARHIIDAVVEALHIAGIRPHLMDIRPLALARAANRANAIVVNMDTDCYDIVFIADGLPKVIHSISPRGEESTLEENIQRLVGGLTKTVAFYESSNPESRPGPDTPLLLTGELADEVMASGLLQSEVEYPIEQLTPPVDSPSDLPAASYAVNIGLALKRTQLKPASREETARLYDVDINILDGKYRKKKAPPVPARKIVFGLILAIAVFALYPLYQARSDITVENADMQTELQGITRELNLAGLVTEQSTLTQESINELITRIETIRTAYSNVLITRGDLTGNLTTVTDSQPSGSGFMSIDIDSFAITVRGGADNVFTVVDYSRALENTGGFEEVRIVRLDENLPDIPGSSDNETMTVEDDLIEFEILISKQIPDILSVDEETLP